MTPSRIIGLQIDNFMRVSAVDISPNGEPVIQITGKNAEGKSSVLNAIWAALQWRDASGSIKEPIRRGEDKASVRVDLGDLIITRTWKGDKTTLQVTTKDGAKYSSPQSILDKLVSEIGFDPLEFTRMQPRDQRTTLMTLLKIDFSTLDQERAELLKSKTIAQAQVTGLDQQFRDIPEIPDDIPDQEVSVGDLLKRIEEVSKVSARKKEIEYFLQNIHNEANEINQKIKSLQERLQQLVSDQNRLITELDQIDPESIEPLHEQLRNIETLNKQVRQKQQKTTITERLKQAEQTVNQITENINLIDQDKRDALESAKFPVPGLSFDETGVLLNGVPFSQASTAEQIRVSLAIGITLNPDLRVLLIRDGSALDSSSLGIVSKMADESDMQVWMERVDESGSIGIVIEDGTVKASPGQQVIS
jgi:DNA repair exonuclease SbcCD ATPase subunit